MKATRALTLLICLFANVILIGQTMQLAWDKTYGTGGFETFHQIIQGTNGLVIAVGETTGQTNGGSDGLVVFLDYTTGNEIFKKNYGGKNNDVIYGVTQTFDGHFILAGSTESKGNGKSDAWVIKIDDTGKQIWERTFGGPKNDAWKSIVTASDGKITLSGNKDKMIWSAHLEDQLLKKEKTFGLKTYKSIKGMASCSDGGVVLVGNTGKSKKRTDGDIWLTKYDKNNNLVWERFFGDKGWEEATGIVATDDGGFAVSGMTKSKGEGDLDFWLVKVSREGFQQWDKTFGGKDADMANGISQLHDGGFMLSGVTKSHRSGARQFKGFLVKTDAGGYRQWQQEYGGDKEDILQSITTLYDGNVVAGGQIQSNRPGRGKAWLVHVKEGGYNQNSLAAVKAMAKVNIDNIALNTNDKIMRPGTP